MSVGQASWHSRLSLRDGASNAFDLWYRPMPQGYERPNESDKETIDVSA
ncbi:MAG: hypothetical protein JNL06_08735 [Alphaproteobacteria bacterium]|nr:hypothetical protein [Alphaproteobacteria bacterium]